MAAAHDVLERFWGYSQFREPQAAVIANAMSGNDSLLVMATGGGKSLCYQIPALVLGAFRVGFRAHGALSHKQHPCVLGRSLTSCASNPLC